jgi:hypothetical protein
VFVRKKRNASGVVSVQVIEKVAGKYVVKQTVGSSKDDAEIEALAAKGVQWIKSQLGALELDFDQQGLRFQQMLDSIEGLGLAGPELILGPIFDGIGFGQIKDEIFRWLVFHRICFPKSKLKTTSYLYQYHGIYWDEDKVYRYLDKLYNKQRQLVQQISFTHTSAMLGADPSLSSMMSLRYILK